MGVENINIENRINNLNESDSSIINQVLNNLDKKSKQNYLDTKEFKTGEINLSYFVKNHEDDFKNFFEAKFGNKTLVS